MHRNVSSHDIDCFRNAARRVSRLAPAFFASLDVTTLLRSAAVMPPFSLSERGRLIEFTRSGEPEQDRRTSFRILL